MKSIFTEKQRKEWNKALATIHQCDSKGCKKPEYYDVIKAWKQEAAQLEQEKMCIIEEFLC